MYAVQPNPPTAPISSPQREITHPLQDTPDHVSNAIVMNLLRFVVVVAIGLMNFADATNKGKLFKIELQRYQREACLRVPGERSESGEMGKGVVVKETTWTEGEVPHSPHGQPTLMM